ncbi:MAG: ATP synthase subunit I [Elusimicrobia bacterium]|nr:ATP synthase subunit I [Elusimicrobiota bacterium]
MNLFWPVSKLVLPIVLVLTVGLRWAGWAPEGWGILAGAGMGLVNVWLLVRVVRGITTPGPRRFVWMVVSLAKFGGYVILLVWLFRQMKISPWATCLGFTGVLAAVGFVGSRWRVTRS